MAIPLYQRIAVPAVHQVTTGNDKIMHTLLTAVIGTGMLDTATVTLSPPPGVT